MKKKFNRLRRFSFQKISFSVYIMDFNIAFIKVVQINDFFNVMNSDKKVQNTTFGFSYMKYSMKHLTLYKR